MRAIGRIAFPGGRALALAAALLLAVSSALASQQAPPTLTSVTAENGEATLEWTHANRPGSFQWRVIKNDSNWSAWAGQISGADRSYTIGNVQSGNTYTFQVRAVYVSQTLTIPPTVTITYTDPSNSMSVTVPDE